MTYDVVIKITTTEWNLIKERASEYFGVEGMPTFLIPDHSGYCTDGDLACTGLTRRVLEIRQGLVTLVVDGVETITILPYNYFK
jgi:hypothetical protein